MNGSGSSSRRIGGSSSSSSSNLKNLAIIILIVINVCLLHSQQSSVASGYYSSASARDVIDSPQLQQHHSDINTPASTASSHHGDVDREVDFLTFQWDYTKDDNNNLQQAPAEMNHKDAFSASWWQPITKFTSLQMFEEVGPSPEGASFDIFISRQGDMRVTRDWLDLGVEHMSKWWKVILDYRNDGNNKNDDLLQRKLDSDLLKQRLEGRVVDIFRRYVHSDDRREFFNALPSSSSSSDGGTELVTQQTLVVIAYMADTSEKAIWGLAATILSLIQVGMGRIVVSSPRQSDERIVRKSFEIVANATSSWGSSIERQPWTEYEYCISANATSVDPYGSVRINVPQAVLQRVRHAFENRTSNHITKCWLGNEQQNNKFKYLFLGEPDLLLVTKPDAIHGLGRALKDGRILAPHRLQPLPHESDFLGIAGMEKEGLGVRVIPNAPPFHDVVEIDAFSNTHNNHLHQHGLSAKTFDSCCDRGTYKPYLLHGECPTRNPFWWMCGYEMMRNHATDEMLKELPDGMSRIMAAHKRLAGYTLMRLKRGTGVVYASAEWGKTCQPSTGLCTKWKGGY